jgi:hypothetical protein
MPKASRECPRCHTRHVIKSGIVGERQRFHCKECKYHFTVEKLGKKIDDYFVIKALQLYLEGISFREIERILGISHVTVLNWVNKYKIKRPVDTQYHPAYKILTHKELLVFLQNPAHLSGHGVLLTEVGDKYMVIKWERFRD